MQEKKFIAKLRQTAREQALFPPSHNRFTAIFWQYAWQTWLLLAIMSAFFFEFWWGRC